MEEISKKQYLEALNRYMCLFEEIMMNGPDLIDRDNFADYRETVREYNRLSPKRYDASGTFAQLEDIENELPWDPAGPDPDVQRDEEQDR